MTSSIQQTHHQQAGSSSSLSTSSTRRKRGRRDVPRTETTQENTYDSRIKEEFLKRCRRDFDRNPENILVRNAVVSVGPDWAGTDSVAAAKVDHVFLNTVKQHGTKATDQESSGRCWMFAGLNVFRHMFIKALNMKNMEFSETYLFFYDKLERANMFLLEVLNNIDAPLDDRYWTHLMEHPIEDGGWWQTFSNLVGKYGLVPKSAMPETYHSGYSGKINEIISTRLHACACKLRRERRMTDAARKLLIADTVQQIHDILVKFLGKPPEKFTWSFHDAGHEPHTISDLTPQSFAGMALGGGLFDPNDFVVLGHFPNKRYDTTYQIRGSINVAGGKPASMLNLKLRDLKPIVTRQAVKIPVWFAGDVTKGGHYGKQAFSETLIDDQQLFGETPHMNKKERLEYHATVPNHAMVFTGVDFDENEMPRKWQVENSWGYRDDDVPGVDGFWVMDDEWFNEHTFEFVVHKMFLSERISNLLDRPRVIVQPWDPLYKIMGPILSDTSHREAYQNHAKKQS